MNLFGAQIQAGVDNLYGALVDRKSAAPGKGGPRGQKEKGWNKEGENKDAIDRLQGIIEVEDPRFEKLKSESIGVWQKRVNELCDSINAGVDRFYVRKTNTYNSVCNANNYCREEFCPTVNLKEVTEDQIQGCAKPWSFDSLPGVNLKTMSLAEDP